MLRGEGTYTTVDGQRCAMQPGDLVVTPSMAWHDHGNSGGQPTMWMDMLDWQVVRFLEKPDLRGLPRRSADGDSQSRRRPVAPLVAGSHAEPDPFDDVLLQYTDPTGGPLRPTLGCYLQLLRRGTRTRAHRETSCAVYHVVAGQGFTTVNDDTFEWEPGDFFVVPPMARHAHGNTGSEPALLFSAQDVPLLKAVGLYRAEPSA